jgi:hypothetical protein
MCARIESSMGSKIFRDGPPKVVRPVAIRRYIGLLRVKSVAREVTIEISREKFVRDNCL